jgi:imidazolonepropionase-like amidohydrolase
MEQAAGQARNLPGKIKEESSMNHLPSKHDAQRNGPSRARGRGASGLRARWLARVSVPGILLFAAGCAEEAPEAGSDAAAVQAFTNAQIFDGTGSPVIENGVILVEDGRITGVGNVDVPEGAEVVDLAGRWVIPGLINSHAHVERVGGQGPSVEEQLDIYAHYGVTTAISLGEDPPEALALRANRDSTGLGTARLYASGVIWSPPSYTPESVDTARAHVNRLAEMGVDWVKIRVDAQLGAAQKMPPEVYQTVISTAQEHGLPVAVHLVDLEDAKGVLEAGAALIAHSVRDQEVDQELIDMMRERNVCLVPTFTRELSTYAYAERPAFLDDPFFLERAAPANIDAFPSDSLMQLQATGAGAAYYKAQLPVAQENLRRLHQAGVGIAFGTDSGTRFPGRFQGYLEHLELEMMVEAGMTPEQALRSATGEAARCVRLQGTVGTLQPGAWADFVVLNASPLEDIRNTREIQSVYIAGNQIR